MPKNELQEMLDNTLVYGEVRMTLGMRELESEFEYMSLGETVELMGGRWDAYDFNWLAFCKGKQQALEVNSSDKYARIIPMSEYELIRGMIEFSSSPDLNAERKRAAKEYVSSKIDMTKFVGVPKSEIGTRAPIMSKIGVAVNSTDDFWSVNSTLFEIFRGPGPLNGRRKKRWVQDSLVIRDYLDKIRVAIREGKDFILMRDEDISNPQLRPAINSLAVMKGFTHGLEKSIPGKRMYGKINLMEFSLENINRFNFDYWANFEPVRTFLDAVNSGKISRTEFDTHQLKPNVQMMSSEEIRKFSSSIKEVIDTTQIFEVSEVDVVDSKSISELLEENEVAKEPKPEQIQARVVHEQEIHQQPVEVISKEKVSTNALAEGSVIYRVKQAAGHLRDLNLLSETIKRDLLNAMVEEILSDFDSFIDS